jgi:hypothetical protein
MEDTIFALLLRDIRSKKDVIRDTLAGGGAASFEEYCKLVGEYSAYDRVEGDIKYLEERFIAN